MSHVGGKNMSRLGPTGLTQLLTNIKTWITTKLGNYVTTDTVQTVTGKKYFTSSTTQVNSVNTFTGSTLFIDTSASAPRGSFPESAYRVGRIYIGDGTSYNGSWFIIDPTIDTNRAYYRMVTTNPDNTDSARFSICWDSRYEGARRRRNISMGDLLPSGASTYNLGESGNAWQDAYINKIHGISDYTNLKTNTFNVNTTLTHGGSGRRVILAMGTITLTVPAPEEGSWFLIKAVNGLVTLNLASNVTVTGITAGAFSGPIHLQPNESILLCYYSSTTYNATISTIRRSGVVGRTGNVPSENPKHWFKIAENYVTATYRDPFICLKVFESTTGNTIGTLCAHCRINNTVGVVDTSNCYLQWQDAGAGFNLSKYALTTNETSGTGVTISLWCQLTGGYSSLKFEVVSECGQSDQLGNPEWVLTRRRQADGDLAELLDTDFTKIVYSTLTTLKNDTTGKASNVTGTVAIANGGTGATTRLNAVKALTNESVGTPTHFLAITTNWGKAGYTTVAQAKTVLGITGDMGSHSDSEYVHRTGNETISGVKTFNSDTLVANQGNAYRIANSAGTGYGVFQRTDGTNWYMLVTANNDPLGTWTSARPITIRLSDGYCTINGKANEANKVQATIAADATTALVQATVASNDCFRIAAGGAANAGWAEIATGDDANEPIYVRQYKGSFTTLQRTATLLDGSGNTSFPGTVTATGFSGPLTGDVTGTASKATGNANGNEITDTVIKGLNISGKTITYTKIDGNTGTLTTQDTVYTHPTTSGNKHIPSGGSSGQFLGWDSDGTAKWVNNPNTNTDTLMTQNVSTTDSTYPILLCATANASSNQGAKTGIFGSGVKVNPKTSVVSAKGFSGIPTGNTYVSAVKDGGALVNSQATAWGAIWRAPTKDYQVAGATWSSTNNNVYICYSVTNANVDAGTNTMAKSLIWAADTGTLTTTTFSGALSGNASTATEFSANKDVTLTGDVTGTASSKAGWSVATTLANSGVTAGTYGPGADVTGSNNATILVPEITVDAKGRVTAVTNRTYTSVNTDTNTDTKVTQTVTSDNACYPLLIANTASASHTGSEPTTETDEVRKAYNINVQARYGFIYARNSYNHDNLKGSVAGGNRTSAGFYGSTYDGATVGGVELGRVDKYGNRYSRLYATNHITDGALAPDGTAVATTFDVGVLADGTKYLNTSAGWYCNVYPTVNNTRTLGTSSLRWKECYSNAYYLGTTAFGDIVTHNASEFLTSHQSLSSCVKNVVTNNQIIKATGITRGTAPSSAQTFGIAFSDNNDRYIGNIYGQYATNKSTYVGLYAYNGTTTSNGDNASVRVGYDASGNAYTYAPTPATADNSTQIATTAFVKAQGYLTSHQSLANYVTTNTDQSISGIKSHSKHISILGSYLGNEFSTNARTCLYLKSNRDTDGQSGIYLSKYRQNVAQGALTGSNLVSLGLDVLENSVRTTSCIAIHFRYFENDVPTKVYVIPKENVTSYMGTTDNPWTNAYAVNFFENGTALSSKYVQINSLAGGNVAGSLTHSIGSLVLARCSSTAFNSVKLYGNVAGLQLYPCRTEICTIYNSSGTQFVPIVVRGTDDSNLGSGTWRYLGGASANFNSSESDVYGMFLRVA